MMLRPRTLLSVLVLFVSTPALAQNAAAPYTSGTRYDIAGRVTGTISASASGTQGPFLATRNSYDASGNLSTVEAGQLANWQDDSISPANWASFTPDRTTSYSYDSYGRKTKEQLYAGTIASGQIASVTQYSYDLYGRVVCTAVRMDPSQWSGQPDACVPQTSGPNGADRITRTSYDYLGNVSIVQRAVGTSLQQNYATYTWNTSTGGAGKPATVADANGNLTSYTYGGTELNLLTRWNFPSPTAVGQSSSADYESYGYDANGNRTSLRKRDGVTITYAYDALNRMTEKNVPASASGAAGYSTFYGYDLRGLQLYARFSSATGPGVASDYDGFGRLITSTNTMGGFSRALAFLYDANGNRTRVTHPGGGNNDYVSYDYDGMDRLDVVRENGATLIADFAYDNVGRRESVAFAGAATNYGYDAVSRLSSLGLELSGTGADQTFGFGYNPASQIVTRTGTNQAFASNTAYNVSRPYSVNGLNQYTTAGPASFGYDDNGNLTSDDSTSFVYDAENRLVSTSGAKNATLSYDPLGRLFQTSGGAGTIQFLYDGDELVAEYDGGGNLLRRYVHGAGVDDPILWYEGAGWGGRRSLFADHQGSIVAVTDGSGSPLAINGYDAWGIPNSGNIGRFQYTGQAWIPELGMYHYKARIYSPTLGRFLQTDPIGYDDQINLYAYVGNDPVNRVDPTGLRCVTIPVVRARYCLPAPAPPPPPPPPPSGGAAAGATAAGAAAVATGAAAVATGAAYGQHVEVTYVKRPRLFLPPPPKREPSITVYRLHGGNSGPLGRSWTTADPRSMRNPRASLGLPDGNTATTLTTGRLVRQEGVISRPALPLDGNPGGGPELIVPNPVLQIQGMRSEPFREPD